MKYRSLRRVGRDRYIFMIVFLTIFYSILGSVGLLIPISGFAAPVIAVVAWGMLTIVFVICRLRDLDASPFWIILTIIPFVNIVFLVALMIIPGTPKINKYGPTPDYFFSRQRDLRRMGMSYKEAAQRIYNEILWEE